MVMIVGCYDLYYYGNVEQTSWSEFNRLVATVMKMLQLDYCCEKSTSNCGLQSKFINL